MKCLDNRQSSIVRIFLFRYQTITICLFRYHFITITIRKTTTNAIEISLLRVDVTLQSTDLKVGSFYPIEIFGCSCGVVDLKHHYYLRRLICSNISGGGHKDDLIRGPTFSRRPWEERQGAWW